MLNLRAIAANRLAWLLLLLIVAAAHYASYYRCTLNFRDEGGTITLVAQRLLAGERPFTDVALGGYNVLWYWPVVAIFQLTGVSYIALRVYCFVLSTITALLVFWIVERAGRKPWLAFLVALLAVVVPGMTFKNYMPFLAVANSACLLGWTLAARGASERWRWLAGGGLLLGATLLIRVDLGLFFATLWCGGSAMSALHRGLAWRERVAAWLGVPAAVLVLAAAAHVPFYVDAKRRGYDDAFIGQYTLWPKMFAFELRRLTAKPQPAASAAPTRALATATEAMPVKQPASREILRRKTWRDAFGAGTAEERMLAALLYLPLLSLVPLVLWSVARWLRALRSADCEEAPRALAALIMLGGALTVFPQYFFFRPDSPHLSEFSPGFWMAVAAAPLLLRLRGWPARMLTALLVLHAAVFLWRMMPDRWTGSIWAMKGRSTPFRAANGVDVRVGKREAESLRVLRDVIARNSQPGEFLVAYPYHPTLNVLADRPTYERNVYVDNATRNATWDAEAIARIETHRPAVIVLSDWAINGGEESRFSVWAAPTRDWIVRHYHAQGLFPVGSDKFEVFTRDATAARP